MDKPIFADLHDGWHALIAARFLLRPDTRVTVFGDMGNTLGFLKSSFWAAKRYSGRCEFEYILLFLSIISSQLARVKAVIDRITSKHVNKLGMSPRLGVGNGDTASADCYLERSLKKLSFAGSVSPK